MTSDNSRAVWQFTPTKWHSAADKEKFARHYLRFVQARCPFEKFHEWFYKRLMRTFMRIAHYNRVGFYATWCDSPEKRFELVRYHTAFDCIGEPAWTWSDVEQTLRTWLNESGIVREYEIEAAAARRIRILEIARAAMGELQDDDVCRLLQEQSAGSLTIANGQQTAQRQSTPRGEQQSLFQL